MKNAQLYRNLLYLSLILAILIFCSCGARKRDRQKNVDKTKIELSTVDIDTSKSVIIQGSKINSTTKETLISKNSTVSVKPIDASKPSTVTREGNTITTTNADVTITENSESKTKTDSINTANFLKERWENYLKKGLNLKKENDLLNKKVNTETNNNTLWLWMALGGTVLGAFGIWLFYKRTGGK